MINSTKQDSLSSIFFTKQLASAEKNSQHALDMAQKLSHQLVAAEQRITDLEAEVERHRDRAERAEQWLHKVYTEIKHRFNTASSVTQPAWHRRALTDCCEQPAWTSQTQRRRNAPFQEAPRRVT